MAADVVDAYGRIDILVNNAGYMTNSQQLPFEEFSVEYEALRYWAGFIISCCSCIICSIICCIMLMRCCIICICEVTLGSIAAPP